MRPPSHWTVHLAGLAPASFSARTGQHMSRQVTAPTVLRAAYSEVAMLDRLMDWIEMNPRTYAAIAFPIALALFAAALCSLYRAMS